MSAVQILTPNKVKKLIQKRNGELKFGERVTLLSNVTDIYAQLKDLDVTYVIFGIPEDVGVFANYGKPGTCNAWETTLKVLLNCQANSFTQPEKVCVLGHINLDSILKSAENLNQSLKKDVEKARQLTSKIDVLVTQVVHDIVSAGKIPIIIGGGHNNAYGNIKGTALALKAPINAVNFDAHTDFRAQEGRHSGNGFSYAYAEGFLNKYFVFGLHENYTSKNLLDTINSTQALAYNTFESIAVRREIKFKKAMQQAKEFINNNAYGIEIDCDAMVNIPSSAMTPSGFTTTQARQFVHDFAKHKNASYLHICEAASKKKGASQVGKLITYLITDFIRANNN